MSTTLAPETVQILTSESPDEIGMILEEAADLIERTDWFNGSCMSDHKLLGRHCAGTAINTASVPHDPFCYRGVSRAAFARLARYLGLETGRDGVIPSWNDAQKSASDVTRALREAAARP